MLDREKCKYLIKTAQFNELNKLIEEEYINLFDGYLKKYIKEEELANMTFVNKVKKIMKLNPKSKGIMMRIINAYLGEEDAVSNINTLLNMYKATIELINK